MTLDSNTGSTITLDEAKNYTHTFQENNREAIKSFFVGSKKLQQILSQDGCIGVRIYNGNDTQNNHQSNLVLVGVDENGEDLSEGVIIEKLSPCPSSCPESSPLIK